MIFLAEFFFHSMQKKFISHSNMYQSAFFDVQVKNKELKKFIPTKVSLAVHKLQSFRFQTLGREKLNAFAVVEIYSKNEQKMRIGYLADGEENYYCFIFSSVSVSRWQSVQNKEINKILTTF